MRPIVRVALAALTIAAALAGCATSYQKQGLSGGFTETQLDKAVFRVSFKGNGFTSPERAADFTLLRSAELALKNGFTHFVIVDGHSNVDYAAYVTPIQSTTFGSATAYGNTAYGARDDDDDRRGRHPDRQAEQHKHHRLLQRPAGQCSRHRVRRAISAQVDFDKVQDQVVMDRPSAIFPAATRRAMPAACATEFHRA